MGFLKRLVGGGDPPAPEWAAFFSGSEYRHFLDVVVALPPRDVVPATTELAGWLRHSVTLASVAGS